MGCTIKKEINSFSDLYSSCWSGAIQTLDAISSAGREDELMQELDGMEFETETELNDYIWFDIRGEEIWNDIF